jgi:hypothetical protein
MKKTSRRNFGKQLSGAIAAAAVTSLVAKGDKLSKDEQRPKTPSEQKGFRTHDTPPPLEFDNGSLVVENAIEFNSTGLNGNRREYRMNPRTGMVIAPAHIRILDGNGEELKYLNDKAAKYLIVIELRDANGDPASSMIINARSTANQDKFVIDVESNKTLQLGNQGNNDKPTSRKRTRRYRHSAAANMSMYKITVRDLATNDDKFTLMPRTLPSRGDDLRIMVWLEPWV